jgi:hypothetical protein
MLSADSSCSVNFGLIKQIFLEIIGKSIYDKFIELPKRRNDERMII